MAHSAQMTMDGRHVLCPDIGADKLWFFTLLPGGRIAPTSPRSHIKLPGGSGPRHLAAHPNGRWLYLICEISCSIVVLSWELSSSSPAEEHTESPTVTEIGIAQLRHCWFLFHVGHGNDLPLGAELTATASERMQCIQLIAFLCVCLVSCLSISPCACVRTGWVTTLPSDWPGVVTPEIGDSLGCTTAHIVVSPDGRFVYGSNRVREGEGSIACFAVDPLTGALSLVSHTPSGGATPRNFCLHPSGDWLVVANAGSNNVRPLLSSLFLCPRMARSIAHSRIRLMAPSGATTRVSCACLLWIEPLAG
jgi:hypothetical protein